MPAAILTAALLSSLAIGGDVVAEGGDYVTVDFEVPANTVEIHITTDYPGGGDILDWGVWAPEGMRGWSGGLRDAIIVGVDDSSRGYLPGAITPGTWTLVIGKATIESAQVSWTGTIEFHDQATRSARPRAANDAVVLDNSKRWYAGDFHVHSSESGDASASLDEIHTLAKEQGLDFVVLSNHNTMSGHALEASAQAAYDDLLLVRGNEVTTYGGHGNAMGVSSMIDHRIGYEGRTADDILNEVEAVGGIFAVNHPNLGLLGVCIGCSWEHDIDWSKVSAMEVHNGNYDIGLTVFTPGVIEIWEEKLAEGYKIAAIGGSDDHSAGVDEGTTGSPLGSPTTRVLADSLAEADILRGVREGRTWVQLAGPSSPFLDLQLEAPDGSSGTIGDTLVGHELLVNLVVDGGDGLKAVLYRDGAVVETQPISGDSGANVQLHAEVPEAGARFHVELSDGLAKVITSHFYGEYQAPPKSDGGGCQVASQRPEWASLLLLVLACLGLRRRRLE